VNWSPEKDGKKKGEMERFSLVWQGSNARPERTIGFILSKRWGKRGGPKRLEERGGLQGTRGGSNERICRKAQREKTGQTFVC